MNFLSVKRLTFRRDIRLRLKMSRKHKTERYRSKAFRLSSSDNFRKFSTLA